MRPLTSTSHGSVRSIQYFLYTYKYIRRLLVSLKSWIRPAQTGTFLNEFTGLLVLVLWLFIGSQFASLLMAVDRMLQRGLSIQCRHSNPFLSQFIPFSLIHFNVTFSVQCILIVQ